MHSNPIDWGEAAGVCGLLYVLFGARALQTPFASLLTIILGIWVSAAIYQSYFEVSLGRGVLIRLAEGGIAFALVLLPRSFFPATLMQRQGIPARR